MDSTAPASTSSSRALAGKLLAFAVLIGAGVLGLRVWPALPQTVNEVPLPESNCSLQAGVCTHTLPNGTVLHFAAGPRPIAADRELVLEARFEGAPPQRVAVDFNGTTMTMAPNRPVLTRGADGRFTGRTELGVCVSGAMEWQALLAMDFGTTRYTLPFVFTAGKPDRP